MKALQITSRQIIGAALVAATLLAPSARAFVVTSFTGDGDIGISTSKVYTHLLDYPGDGAPATINGVPFTAAGLSGPTWSLSIPNLGTFGAPGSGTGTTRLLSDFYYSQNGGTITETFTLSGLTAGGRYDTRFYSEAFGGAGGRTQNVGFTNGSQTDSILGYDENAGRQYLSETFLSQGTSVVFTFTSLINNASYHQYGLSNQLLNVPEPSTLLLLGAGGGLLLKLRRKSKKA